MQTKKQARSVLGAIEIFQDAQKPPEQPKIAVPPENRETFDQIWFSRNREEWTALDLRLAWHLAEVLVEYDKVVLGLREEGYLVRTGPKEPPEVNVRLSLVERLERRILTLQARLRLHAAATSAAQPGAVAKRRTALQDATEVLTDDAEELQPHRRARAS